MMLNGKLKTQFGITVIPKILKTDGSIEVLEAQHNLILDSGLEALVDTHVCTCFEWAAVGDSNTATERESGVGVTVAQSGITITASGGSPFTGDDAGRVLKFGTSGNVVRIETYVSGTQVEVIAADTGTEDAGQAFTIYNVEQTTLGNRLASTDTYRNTGNAENGSSNDLTSGDYRIIRNWRTFAFDAETGSVTYTEAGWSWDDPATTSLFGRIVFDTPVDLDTGESLLLNVILDQYIDVSTKDTDDDTPAYLPITNLTESAQYRFVWGLYTYTGVSTILATGVSYLNAVDDPGEGILEPYTGADVQYAAISDDDTVITSESPPPQPSNYDNVSATWSRVGSDYAKTITFYWNGPSIDLTDWEDIRINSLITYTRPGFRIKFDSTQTKPTTKTVSLTFIKTWDRYLG